MNTLGKIALANEREVSLFYEHYYRDDSGHHEWTEYIDTIIVDATALPSRISHKGIEYEKADQLSGNGNVAYVNWAM